MGTNHGANVAVDQEVVDTVCVQNELGACAMLLHQCHSANVVDCCRIVAWGFPREARNACLHAPEWGSIEDWILESGLVDHSQEKI